MSEQAPITDEECDRLSRQLGADAESAGYHLNPDGAFVRGLARGLIENERRYGYRSCPCRLSLGTKEEDLDIVCPCDYRDPDLAEHGACYCALYVSDEIRRGEETAGAIPDRRPPRAERARRRSEGPPQSGPLGPLPYPVWRCGVCGYICARDEPPLQCPICKVGRERFDRFI